MPRQVSQTDADFTEFVRLRSAALLRTAYLLTGDRGHAEDLVQTVLAKLYVSWGRLRDPQALEAYARRTLVTTATSWWRKRSNRNERPRGSEREAAPDPGVSAKTDDVDDRILLWSQLRALPPRQRAVIVLRYYEDLTEHETARALGVAVGTVKAHAHRALTRLRASLGEDITTVREDA